MVARTGNTIESGEKLEAVRLGSGYEIPTFGLPVRFVFRVFIVPVHAPPDDSCTGRLSGRTIANVKRFHTFRWVLPAVCYYSTVTATVKSGLFSFFQFLS